MYPCICYPSFSSRDICTLEKDSIFISTSLRFIIRLWFCFSISISFSWYFSSIYWSLPCNCCNLDSTITFLSLISLCLSLCFSSESSKYLREGGCCLLSIESGSTVIIWCIWLLSLWLEKNRFSSLVPSSSLATYSSLLSDLSIKASTGESVEESLRFDCLIVE